MCYFLLLFDKLKNISKLSGRVINWPTGPYEAAIASHGSQDFFKIISQGEDITILRFITFLLSTVLRDDNIIGGVGYIVIQAKMIFYVSLG